MKTGLPPLSSTAAFRPLALPLRGSHLIEASAGTGKTFTIAMLYVRLVLGHGEEHAFLGGPLTPPQILVVTFTEAATQELRDRIRARLAEAAAYFRAPPVSVPLPEGQDLLHDVRAAYPQTIWPACARRLDVAAEWMDEAAVSTIHGWCHRMLREHAFDSLSLFTQTLETDPAELRSEVVRDYWRQFYYPLSPSDTQAVSAYWTLPAQLDQAVRDLLDHTPQLPEAASPAELLAQCERDRAQALQTLKQPWASWVDELTQALKEAKALKRFHGNKLRESHYTDWLNKLRLWATTDLAQPGLSDSAWKRITPEGIADAWHDDQPLDHPALHALPRLRVALRQLPAPRVGLLCHAARWIATEFDATQRRRSQLGFDDLLTSLEAALNSDNGARLAALIRQQFPVALIDEFQDTDPVQYRIFERIYELAQNRQDSALILIGDPKQAIYAFRGADIHTYLKARAAVGERLHTLDTNHRSTEALVTATNHCFQHVEQDPASNGAFLFRRQGHNPVPFTPVHAKGLKAHFQIQGQTPAAIQLQVLPQEGKLSKEAYIEQMAHISATQLATWLNLGHAAQAGFVHPDTGLLPLQPGDIAILVNNQHEAHAMRRALALRGIRSVYLSDKGTVYETPQATEVYRWLLACAEPDNDRLLRAALATPTLGLDFQALESLHSDELAWESRLEQFRTYHALWQQQGVLPMLRRILVDFNCSQRLRRLENDDLGQSGERILTDLLHLAELLQQASFTLEGEHALTRFLAEQLAQPRGSSDDRQLRLESDAHLVQVITIHKSKGLEYPLVWLPFICATRQVKATDVPITWHDETGEARVCLEADDALLQRADQERLGEDLRKLYVALTRARHFTWLGLAHLETTPASAVAHLMGLQHTTPATFVQAVSDFAQGQPALQVVDTHPVDASRFLGGAVTVHDGEACRPRRPAREHWWISSYSGLAIGGTRDMTSPELEDTPQTENWREGQQERLLSDTSTRFDPSPLEASAMHRFPKGALPGTFLHDLLEWCANTGLTTVLQAPAQLREMVARRCSVHHWDDWIDPLCDWVQQLLTTPLPVGQRPLRLDSVSTARAEMEFWIETRQLDLQALDDAVIRHTLGRRPRPALSPHTLTGMLKGFMDLVFEHEGRYYVADYKSNWLGASNADYTAQAMDAAIRAHRYDLQYVLYLFALHRLLRSRLPDYDYEQHMGGAVYLFVRGIGSPGAGVHVERPPRVLMDTLDALFTGHIVNVS
jgi:exodeoxyribonuclease V beta subunit